MQDCKIPGVYCVKNIITGKRYIGHAINMQGRWKKHFRCLRGEYHPNRFLQSSFNKYGSKAWKVSILFEVPIRRHLEDKEKVWLKEKLVNAEQFFMDYYDSSNRKRGYNLSPAARSTLGVKLSKEARKKISLAARGRPSPMQGKHHSAETRKKISRSMKNIPPISEETRQRIREASLGRPCVMKGKHYPKWFGEKISKATKGKNHPLYGTHHSKETRMKISKSLIDFWRSKEEV